MRLHLSLLGLALLVSACSMGGDTRSAAATEKAATDVAREAMGLSAGAVSGTDLSAGGRWRTCSGGVGHHFQGGGELAAGRGNPDQQLEAIREALTGAGFSDVTQVSDQVAVERDEITVVVSPPAVERFWRVSFRSACHTYSGDDEALVEDQTLKEIDGLEP